MPSKRMFKFGAAAFAATVGVILAITTAGAHSTPAAPSKPAMHSSNQQVLTRILTAAMFAGAPMAVNDPASSGLLAEQGQDAEEAAEAAAKAAAEAAELAAQQAAEAAQDAAELAAEQAAAACKATDQSEDVTEKSNDQPEDTSEKGISESADVSEDVNEKAGDKTEDSTEPKCHEVNVEQKSDGGGEHHDNEGSSKTTFANKD